MKVPFTICADIESLLEKISNCHNIPKKSSATKINKHATSDCSLFTDCPFDATKNKPDCYSGLDRMKRLCKDLKEHATKIINFGKKEEIIPLTNEENESYIKQMVCHICKKEFSINYKKARGHCPYTRKCRGAAHNNYNLNYKESKEIPVVFHNGSPYDYHFIIKELAMEFN